MQPQSRKIIPVSGSPIDRTAKVMLVVLTCFSSLFVLGFIYWQKTKKQKIEVVQAAEVQEKEQMRNRQARILDTAKSLVRKDRGYVIFHHGTVVVIPISERTPEDLAKSALLSMKSADDSITEMPVDGGHILCQLGGPLISFLYADELKATAKENLLEKLRNNYELDREEKKIIQIYLPENTDEATTSSSPAPSE